MSPLTAKIDNGAGNFSRGDTVKNKSARVMGKKPPTFKDLKTATGAFSATIRQVTKSAKLSTKLTKLLKEHEVVVIKFDYSGFPTHIILRKACESLGLLCAFPDNALTPQQHSARAT